MEAKERLYIVSFGDSRKYKVEFKDVDNVDNYHHTDPLKIIEQEISEYLQKEFPGQSLAYFTTPKITEVKWSDREKYADYPELDRVEVEKIKSVLKREIEMRQDLDRLDRNAPFDQISTAS